MTVWLSSISSYAAGLLSALAWFHTRRRLRERGTRAADKSSVAAWAPVRGWFRRLRTRRAAAAEPSRQVVRELGTSSHSAEVPFTRSLSISALDEQIEALDGDTEAVPVPPALPEPTGRSDPLAEPPAEDVVEPWVDIPEDGDNDGGMADSIAWLRGSRGDFLISRVTTVLGRSAKCDVVLDDDLVSRRHCEISFDGQDWWLAPYDTPNGTYLNGMRQEPGQPVRLRSQDVIGVGVVEFALFVPKSNSKPGSLVFNAAGASVVGGRTRNEDDFHADERLIAVADGVGGRPAGAVAAELAVSGMRTAGPDQNLVRTVREINDVIRSRGEEDPLAAGLATTLDAVLLRRKWATQVVQGVHVGDGTVLVQRDTAPESLVQPHSLAHELVVAGHGASDVQHAENRLMRAVGLDTSVEPDRWELPAVPGHRYILASDGLSDALGTEVLNKALVRLRTASPADCVRRLIDLAVAAHARDNVTVVVADVMSLVEGT